MLILMVTTIANQRRLRRRQQRQSIENMSIYLYFSLAAASLVLSVRCNLLQILVTVMASSHNNNMFITRDPSLLLVT